MTSRSTTLFCLALLVAATATQSACTGAGPPEDTPSGPPLFLTDDCLELDRYSCEIRADCLADFCFLCSCTPQYQGCRSAIARPLSCPLLDCPRPDCCTDTADCPFPEDRCATPATARSCAACAAEAGDCGEDADCQFWEICEPIPCSCTGAGRCVRGCVQHHDACDPAGCSVPGHCGAGEHCSCSDHPRCLPEPCGTFEDCAADHDCVAGDCVRTPCERDEDCEIACVNGQCHEAYGECLSGSST